MLADTVRAVLRNSGKSLAPDAFKALIETTGFELRAIVNNLEKLVSYVGAEILSLGKTSSQRSNGQKKIRYTPSRGPLRPATGTTLCFT